MPNREPDKNAAMTGWVGRSLHRREDAVLLGGQAHFMDDLVPLAGMAEAAILRSPQAHSRIARIDPTRALAMPGVHAVLTGEHVAALSDAVPNALHAPISYYPMAIDRTRYVGEPMAVVVADDRYVAEDALDQIDVALDPLPAIIDPALALNDDAPVLHEALKSNRVHHKIFRFGDPDGAFASAAHVIDVAVEYPRIMSTPIETYGVIANYEPAVNRYSIWSNFQGPFIGHSLIAAALRVSSGRLRMISAPNSGGSFGVKWGVFPYAILLALAARVAKRPVKWIEDRAEHLAASSCSTDRITRMSGAFAADGELLGLRINQLENVGAYLRPPEPSTLYRSHGNLNGPYRVKHIEVDNTIVLTNQMPTGLNRGFGGPQYFFPLERLMHEAARRLRIDTQVLHSRNFVRRGEMPYSCPSGVVLDGGDYEATLKCAADLADYEMLKVERERARDDGELFGIGISTAVESSASSLAYVNAALTTAERARGLEKSGGIATATISIDPASQVVVRIPTIPAGQGHETVIGQIVADELGLEPGDIHVVTAVDTDHSEWSITTGNYANRFSGADTTAAVMAARKIADKFRRLAAYALETSPDKIELSGGMARRIDGNTSVPLKRLAAWTHWNSSRLPEGEEGGMSETATFTPTTLLQPDEHDRVATCLSSTLLCDVAAVRISRETGQIDVVNYATAHDLGRILNPALVEGQVRGGFAHGLGAALLEQIRYDDQGNLLTGTFADYLCPTASDIPELAIGEVNHRTDRNALGARGLGDGSSMNAPAAIANAVADALDADNVQIPLTPSRVWRLIHSAALGRPQADESDTSVKTPRKRMATASSNEIRGSGETVLNDTPASVWRVLFDVDGLRRIIPGCRDLVEIEPDVFVATIAISIAGIRSTYNARVTLSEKMEPTSIRISGTGEGRLGHGQGQADVRLSAEGEGGTRLHYRYRAEVGGRIASVGSRMLDGVVRLLVQQFFSSLSQYLDSGQSRNRGWHRVLWLLGRLKSQA